MKLQLSALLIAGLLAGCAGRNPAPVAIVQATDQAATCQSIAAEIQANNVKMQALVAEEGRTMENNMAAAVTGAVLPVLYLWSDFKFAAQKEEQALQARQQFLGSLAAERCKR
jgi:phosphosulfolactate phosphohydrolase-like enzyme